MGPLIIAFLTGWFLTPLVINIFWLVVFAMPFIAIYNHDSAGFIVVAFSISALLIPYPFRPVYVVGAIGAVIFMLLSSVAVAAYVYAVSHPDQIALAAATGVAILLFFVPRRPPAMTNER